jgi:hypothetical protein
MIHIQCDITAPLKFFDEWATYQFVVSNSTSQMHKMGSKMLTEEDFSSIDGAMLERVNFRIRRYQDAKERGTDEEIKEKWRKMIDSVPQSFLYTRTVNLNYETFLCMYFNRKSHKMEEWCQFCKVLREELPYMDEFIKVLEEKPKKKTFWQKFKELWRNLKRGKR